MSAFDFVRSASFVILLAAVVSALYALFKMVVRPVYRAAVDMGHKLNQILEASTYVETEMRYNGGSSARDYISELRKSMLESSRRFVKIEQHLGIIDDSTAIRMIAEIDMREAELIAIESLIRARRVDELEAARLKKDGAS
jgi:hypothetical protein